MKFPVFDLHCDTATAMIGRGPDTRVTLKANDLHIDLERSSAFPGYAQCFAFCTSPLDNLCKQYSPEMVFDVAYRNLLQQIQENDGTIQIAKNFNDLSQHKEQGIASAILTLEGPACIQYDPGKLNELFSMGFRVSTLGWNEENCLTGSHCCGGGLTDRGREYIRSAQKLGIVIDVSHISDAGFWDIMDITETCIVASHSNARQLQPVSRNLTDDMFLAVCQTDGVVGINLFADFLGENPTIDRICDHIFHFLELDPTGTHIALGGDLDGCDALPQGFCDVGSYSLISERLLERGLPEKMVDNIFWNNAMGVFEKCCT